MQIFWIRAESGEDFWGPYTERSLADRVLKIASMAGYHAGAYNRELSELKSAVNAMEAA